LEAAFKVSEHVHEQANVALQNDNTRDQLNTINRHYQNALAVGLIDDNVPQACGE